LKKRVKNVIMKQKQVRRMRMRMNNPWWWSPSK